MSRDERTATAALRQIATEARPARLPLDLWARGRRWQRRRIVAMAFAAVLLAALAVVPALFLASRGPAPAEDPPSIPSRVFDPLPLQPNLVDAPNGPASLILTGPGGFGKTDLDGYQDRAVVVGRDGQYRYLRQTSGFDAGETVLLSPDGRWVAGILLDGSNTDVPSQPGVIDLTNGHLRYFDGRPLIWSPDGRLLVALDSGQRKLVDPETGAMVDAGGYGPAQSVFSPDSRLLATKIRSELTIRDIATGTERTISGLPDRAVLAGPGAWRADGRIAFWQSSACATMCPQGWADFSLSHVDVTTGSAVVGPDLQPVRAEKPSLLGWQSDGDAVVALTFRMNQFAMDTCAGPSCVPPQWQAPRVVALHPGGGQTTLVTTPASADRIDVARGLLDRFGAPPPSLGSRMVDVARARAPQMLAIVAVLALIVAPFIVKRIRRRRRITGIQRVPVRELSTAELIQAIQRAAPPTLSSEPPPPPTSDPDSTHGLPSI
jgi:hypothetical protein